MKNLGDLDIKTLHTALAHWSNKKADAAEVLIDLIDDAADETMERYEARMKETVDRLHTANDVIEILHELIEEKNGK